MIQKIMSVLLAFIANLKKRNIYAAISPHLWETLPAPTRWVLFIYLFFIFTKVLFA